MTDTPSGSGAPRDDEAPTVDALRIALADAQTAFSGEDDRHAALGWLVDHLSSLIADSTRWNRVQNEGLSVALQNGQFVAWERDSSVAYGEPDARFAIDSIPSAPPHTGASDA